MPIEESIYQQLRITCERFGAQLVVVSKTRPLEDIRRLYALGQRAFGENRVQDLVNRAQQLPDDIEWHLIGHLQSNKVQQALPVVSFIHSVDSLKLVRKMDEEASRIHKRIPCLLQIKIAAEETKYGWEYDALLRVLAEGLVQQTPFIEWRGVMGMASLTDDRAQIRREMHFLKQSFDSIKSTSFATDAAFDTISMGMSGDYTIALEEGSTMVRVGSLLFR